MTLYFWLHIAEFYCHMFAFIQPDMGLSLHTCHISHCEIKSHRIWPIWKPIPIRTFKSHRIFRPSYNIFYEEININHTLLCLSQALTFKKAFDYFGGAQSDFCKNLTEFYQLSISSSLKICLISQISVHSLWHFVSGLYADLENGG